MLSTDFSVLLLAWDDADPAVAVLGGSALPPTLPLVYQLAAQRPVLAVYPHIPADETTAALESSVPAGAARVARRPVAAAAAGGPAAAFAPSGPLEVAADAPGVHLLPLAAAAGSRLAATTGGSRLVGLDDLLPAIQQALPTAHSLTLGPGAASDAGELLAEAAPNRSQWPAHAGTLRAGGWQAPAAPYAGAAEPESAAKKPSYATRREFFPPPPAAPPRTEPTATTAPLAASVAAGASAIEAPPAPGAAMLLLAASTAISPTASRPDTVVPATFDEPVAEIGAAEANDLSAPEDDLVPDVVPRAAAVVPETTAAAPEPAAAWAMRQPTLDGLNFRMIQYARRAAQLVDGRHDFNVIYAPGWPAWLAALEIRNRSGRPLVLYVPALASATAPTADRGWLLGVERMVLRRATLVLVPDADVLRQVRARHADVPGEIRVVSADDETTLKLVLAEVARG